MKELFGINVTENRKNTEFDGERYITSRLGSSASDEMEKVFDKMNEIEEKGTLPMWLYIVAYILWILGAIVLINVVPDFSKSWRNAPGLVIGGVVLFVVGGGLLLFEKLKKRSNMKREEYCNADVELGKDIDSANAELDIPSDAETVNVFTYFYKNKDGKNVIRERFRGHFINCDARIFKNGDDFCVADLEMRYDIPLSCIREVGIEKKGCFVSGWTKDVPPSAYKIRTDNLGRYCFRNRGYMLFYLSGQEFRLYFPEYELPVFKRVIGRE